MLLWLALGDVDEQRREEQRHARVVVAPREVRKSRRERHSMTCAKLKTFKVSDALGRAQEIEAPTMAAAISAISRTGKRNLFGVERGDQSKFLLDRGSGPLWPISARAAQMELGMGGFKK